MLCGVGCGWSFPLILICLIGAGLSNDTPQIEKVGTMTRSGVLIQNESWIFDSIIFSGWSNAVHYVWIPRPGVWMTMNEINNRLFLLEMWDFRCCVYWPHKNARLPLLLTILYLFKTSSFLSVHIVGSPHINLNQSVDNSQPIFVNHSDS